MSALRWFIILIYVIPLTSLIIFFFFMDIKHNYLMKKKYKEQIMDYEHLKYCPSCRFPLPSSIRTIRDSLLSCRYQKGYRQCPKCKYSINYISKRKGIG